MSYDQRRALTIGADDGGRVAARVALDRRHISTAVRDLRQAARAIVTELVEDGSREGFQRAQMATVPVEVIKLRPVRRGHHEVTRAKPGQCRSHPADAELTHVGYVQAAVRTQRDYRFG